MGRRKKSNKAGDSKKDSKTENVQTDQDNVVELVQNVMISIKINEGTNFPLTINKQALDQTTVLELQATILESCTHNYITCFSIEHDGKVLPPHTLLSAIEDWNYSLSLGPKDYNRKELVSHLNRLQLILGFESAGLGYGFSQAMLDNFPKSCDSGVEALIPNQVSIKPWKSFSKNAFSPPTPVRKQAGDIAYFTFNSLEGNSFFIVANAQGFYVTKEGVPHKVAEPFHELPDLLSSLSCGFKEAMDQAMKSLSQKHLFSFIEANPGMFPWIVGHQPSHSPQLIFGDIPEFRDWNDEFSSIKELKPSSGPERLLREQALARVHWDFHKAALEGVKLLLEGSLVPLNPTEPKELYMYLHNNIFYSQGFDSREQFRNLGSEAMHVAFSKDVDGVKLLNRLDIGVHSLCTAVVDFSGHRVVCQSIIPGILKRDVSESSDVMVGSIDGGGKICNDECFSEVVQEVSTAFGFEEHTVLDAKGSAHKLHTSVDMKGIRGSDGRKYFLDLYRCCPVDINFLHNEKYPHKMVLIRRELIDEFRDFKLKEFYDDHKAEIEGGKPVSFDVKVTFNPDSFTDVPSGDCSDLVNNQKENVRAISNYLIGVQVPRLANYLASVGSAMVLDTGSLTRVFHRIGVNMRYLGKVTSLVEGLKRISVPVIKVLLREEMIARASKKLLRAQLMPLPLFKTAGVIAEFFNDLFNCGRICGLISKEISARFLFEITTEEITQVVSSRKYQLLRSLCLKMGIQLEGRNFFDSQREAYFAKSDIINLVPLSKHSEPKSSFGEEVFEAARQHMQSDSAELGLELADEALAICEQTCGQIHPDTGYMYSRLSVLYQQLGKTEIAHAHLCKAVLIHERTFGIDDPQVLQLYLNLATLELELDRPESALRLMQHFKVVWKFHCGDSLHTEYARAEIQMAQIYQRMDKLEEAEASFKSAHAILEELLGKENISTLQSLELLTTHYVARKDFKAALAGVRSSYHTFAKLYGTSHERTLEYEGYMKSFAERAVMQAKLLKAPSL